MNWVSKTFFKPRPKYIELKAQDGDRIVFKILKVERLGDTVVMELEQPREPIAVEV